MNRTMTGRPFSLLKKIPFHLVLFAVYPVLSLYALNISEVNIQYVLRPLLVALIIGITAFVICWFLFKENGNLAAITGVGLLLVSSYGAVFNLLQGVTVGGVLFGRHRILLPIYLILIAVILWQVWMIGRSRQGITNALNFMSILLLLMPVMQIVVNIGKSAGNTAPEKGRTQTTTAINSANTMPDIYYFVLDSYGREDYIREYMDFDNSGFIGDLKELGFFVGDCSLSNYAFTRLSLASTLNMDYLENLSGTFPQESNDATLLDDLIVNSKVRKTLSEAGYSSVAFETGYPFTEMSDAEYYFQPNKQPLKMAAKSPFEVMVINNTIAGGLSSIPFFKQWFGGFPYLEKYQRQRFIIEQVKSIPQLPGSKFAFIHLVTTHRPYIFQSDGSILYDENYYKNDGVPADENYYTRGYQYQLEYTNRYMLDLIKTILADSSMPPIIIIQGDHGVRDPGRLSILNAIYPGSDPEEFYPSITPVNTFRVILNKLGLGKFDLLPDRSYYSNANKSPYKLVEINGSPADCKIR